MVTNFQRFWSELVDSGKASNKEHDRPDEHDVGEEGVNRQNRNDHYEGVLGYTLRENTARKLTSIIGGEVASVVGDALSGIRIVRACAKVSVAVRLTEVAVLRSAGLDTLVKSKNSVGDLRPLRRVS